MARPQTDSGVDSTGPGRQQSCRMEALRPEAWPNGAIQPAHQPCHRHRNVATQSSLISAPQRDASPPPSSTSHHNLPSRDSTGADGEHPNTAESQLLPGLPPQIQSPLADSTVSGAPGDVDPRLEDEAVERVAAQLRTIGDEMNAMFLQRRNDAPQWQDWRGLCRGLLTFITDTLGTLYQHRLR